jgi:glycosyltransferase involved in cell wall biosynthesis
MTSQAHPAPPSGGAARRPRVAVCIATYRRPRGLSRLLRALAAQRFAGGAPWLDVVVADNDAAESAREACEEARPWLGHTLHYRVAPRRGIPQARNTALGVALAFADFVAFCDDDTEPAGDWLAALLAAQARFGADVVAGPCEPRFAEPPPDWVVAGGFHRRERHATGTPVERAATHNALVRASALRGLERWFDEGLALQGGEDSELFARLRLAGRRMVWADEALVHEWIAPARTSARWLARRAFRIANARAAPALRRVEGRGRAGAALAGLRGLAKGSLRAGAALARGPAARVDALLLLASGAGWLCGALGLRFEAYRRTDVEAELRPSGAPEAARGSSGS